MLSVVLSVDHVVKLIWPRQCGEVVCVVESAKTSNQPHEAECDDLFRPRSMSIGLLLEKKEK